MPAISIIVPVYNVEPYLRQCVDSILAQTYTDFELILIDDGSPDNCGAICEEYAHQDQRIHVIHQHNRGLSAARNTGIEWSFTNSNSDWLMFVDSDDAVHPKFLEKMAWAASEYNAELISCGCVQFTDSKYLEESSNPQTYVSLYNNVTACIGVYTDNWNIGISAWGKLYKKKLFQTIRFPIGKLHEDQAVVPKLLYSAERIIAITPPMYYYRIRRDSITHEKFSDKRFDDLEALDNCISFFARHREHGIVDIALRRRKIIKAIYNLLAIADGVHRTIPKKYKMSELAALCLLRGELTDSKYTYYLAKIHPTWILPHDYLRKIKKTLHIPCK